MKQIKLTTLALFCAIASSAQLVVSDFETFTLSPGTYYNDTTNTPFTTQNALFQHKNDKFGNFWYWTGGFSYTNVLDSSDGSYMNLYGVKAYKGYNASDKFVIAQDNGVIQLASVQNTVEGFYVTNTTFAYKIILYGDTVFYVSRKFGDTTGTGSGTTIPQGSYPDFFKLTVKGFKNGQMITDSVEFYLADYRFQNNALDYIVDTWQWVNTSSLGEVDSLKFFMYSSDVGGFGINTPLFFALDNFTTKGQIVGIEENDAFSGIKVYPMPFHDLITISAGANFPAGSELRVLDLQGRLVVFSNLNLNETSIDLSGLTSGLYLLEIKNGKTIGRIKILKE